MIAEADISFRVLLDSVEDPLFVRDLDKNVIFMNRAAARVIELRSGEPPGQKCYELFGDAAHACRHNCPAERVIATGARLRHDAANLIDRHGRSRRMRVQLSPYRVNGEIRGSIVVLKDLARPARQEPPPAPKLSSTGALPSGEAPFRALVESAAGMPWALDVATNRFTYVGPQAEALTGYPSEAWSGFRFWAGLLHPDDREATLRECLRAVAAGEDCKLTYRLIARDGRVAWISDTVRVACAEGRATTLRGYLCDVTEQKEAERALRANQRLLRAVVDALPDWVTVRDEDGRYVMVNRQRLQDTGLQEADFLGRRMQELPYPTSEQIEFVEQVHRRVMTSGMPERVPKYRATFNDGSQRTFDVSVIPLKREDGKTAQVLTVGRDITEQERGEAAVRRSQQLLRSVVDALPTWATVKDADGRFLMVNQRWRELMGLTEAEVLGKRFADLGTATAEDVASRGALDRLVLQTGRTVEGGPMPLTLRNGRTRIVESTRIPLRDAQGNVTRLLIVGHDVTERVEAERVLRESEAKYRDLVEGSVQGIVVHRNFVPLFVNQAYANLFGYDSPEEIYALGTVEPLMDRRDIPGVHRRNAARMQGRSAPTHVRITGVRKDGSKIMLDVVAKRVVWEGKAAVQGTFLDISERDRLEEQLRQSQKFQAVGELAGGIAHDLNNILQPISLFSELLMQRLPTDERMEYMLRVMHTSVRRAKDMIAKILLFGRRSEFKPEVCNPRDIINESFTILATLPTTVRIDTQFDGEIPDIEADFGQVQQVVINLCVNAAHAMGDRGRISVHVSTVPHTGVRSIHNQPVDVGRYVRIAVTDEGAGIPQAILGKIFEPFYSTKREGEGSGLGLAVVLGIVERHGGAVNVMSEEGAGSTFEVFFKALDGDHREDEREPDAPKATPGSARILVVDDEELLATSIELTLTELGYSVDVALTSADALNRFRERSAGFDLVLLDQTMPEMTGDQLLGELRRIRPDIKVVMGTGYSETMSEERAMEIGADRFYRKPISLQELSTLVHEVLQGT